MTGQIQLKIKGDELQVESAGETSVEGISRGNKNWEG